jgi:NADPH:quinone reductase-like Zn-dependent oxidoreductase
MLRVMMRNLSIVGNCIGLASDLEHALRDYEAGRLACAVDSVFGGTDTEPFLERTYNDRSRFGKVVFRYVE